MAKTQMNGCEELRLELKAAQERIADLERDNQKLVAQSQLVQGVLDAMPETLVRFDMDYKLLIVNQAFARLHGKSPQELMGTSLLEVVSPEVAGVVQNQVAALTAAAPVKQNVSRNQDADGNTYWMEWTDTAVLDEQGSVIGYQSVGRDISARYKLQMDLQRNIAILDQAEDIIAMSDLDGFLLYVNEAGARILGYDSPAQLVGTHVSRLQADADAVRYLRDVIVPSMLKSQWRGETRLRKRDGTVIDVEQTAFSIRQADQPVYLATIVRDITQKKRTEYELQRSEDRFALIFATIPYAVAIVRLSDFAFREVNNMFADTYGVTREQVIGRSPQDVALLSRFIDFDQIRETVLTSGILSDRDVTFQDSTGSTHYGLMSAIPLSFEQEPHLLVAVQDVTHIRTLQAREEQMVSYLREVVKATDELISIEDDVTFARRVVELMRERLGVERASLFLGDENREVVRGTFGTDAEGNTVDEQAVTFPGVMLRDLDTLTPPWFLLEDTELNYWDGEQVRQFARGWLASVFIRTGNQVTGFITYDSALTGAPFDPARHEAIMIYANLIGNILRRRRTEKELRVADQRYRMIVENSNAAMIQIAVDGTFLFLNDRAAEYYGRPVQEIRNRNVVDVYPADQARSILRSLGRIMETGELIQYESPGPAGATHRIYSTVVYPLRDENGDTTSFMLNALDITPIREAQSALKEAEERYRTIVETAQEGILIGDSSGCIQYVNQHCCQLFGLSADQMIDRMIGSFVRTEAPPLDGNTYIMVEEGVLDRYLERRRAGMSDRYDLLIRRPDASERWISVSATPLRSAAGEIVGFLSMYADITERKHAEVMQEAMLAELERRVQERTAQLESERTLLRTLIDSIPDLIYVKDLDHRYIICNQTTANVFGVDSPDQLLGRTATELIPLDFALRFEKSEDALIENGDMIRNVAAHTPFFGEEFEWSLTNIVPLRSKDEHIIGLVGLTRSITEQKRAEQTLERKYQEEQQLRAYLRTLHEIMLEMTEIDDLDQLYRHVVEAAVARLDYERFGLFLHDEEQNCATCTYGVDVDGRVVPAYNLRISLADDDLLVRAMQDPTHFYVGANTEILNGSRQVIGSGMTAAVALVHGDAVLGWITVDNLLRKQPLSPLRLEVLAQYAVLIASVLVRKQTEQALRQSELTYRSVVTALSEGILLRSAENGRVIASNRAAEKILGLTVDQMSGKAPIDPNWQIIYEDGTPFPAELQPARVTLLTGQPQVDVVMGVQKPDGMLTWITANSQPIFDGDTDKPSAAVVTLTDTTRRKQAEDALRESEAKYRQLLDRMGGAAMMFDVDWNMTYANDRTCELSGYTREELLGSGYWRILTPEMQARMIETREIRSRGESTTYEMPMICKDGSVRTMLVNGMPLYDSSGNPSGSFSVSVDITAQKQAEDALRRALGREQELGQLKTQFVSTTSHEFRTPLAIINAVAETLLKFRDRLAPDQVDERLQKIRGQVSHLRQIMDDVLQLAKIQAGRMEFRPEISDLGQLCEVVIEEINTMLEAENRIRYQAPSAPIEMAFDRRLMRQILINLLSNGLKYSTMDQPVDIALQRIDDSVLLRVQDYGIGIPADNLANIFEPFHRAANVGTIPGTGLGMPIVRESVHLHNGHITLESEENEGTTINIMLPFTLEIPERQDQSDDAGAIGLLVE